MDPRERLKLDHVQNYDQRQALKNLPNQGITEHLAMTLDTIAYHDRIDFAPRDQEEDDRLAQMISDDSIEWIRRYGSYVLALLKGEAPWPPEEGRTIWEDDDPI
jgi:hypothetical protein